jgi:hypothetical protein
MRCNSCGREFSDRDVFNNHDCRDINAMEERIEELEEMVITYSEIIINMCGRTQSVECSDCPESLCVNKQEVVQEILKKREVPK